LLLALAVLGVAVTTGALAAPAKTAAVGVATATPVLPFGCTVTPYNACPARPCNPGEKAPPATGSVVRYYRTRQGVRIRLLPISLPIPVTGLALSGDTVVWAEPAYSRPHDAFMHPPRLYMGSVSHFWPVLVSQGSDCGAFENVTVSAHWLVWSRYVATRPYGPAVDDMRALDLRTGRSYRLNPEARPQEGPADLGPFSLDGDTLTWLHVTSKGNEETYSIVSRQLPDGPISTLETLVSSVVQDRGAPRVQRIYAPQRVGRYLTWTRERWTGTAVATDVMLIDLETRRVRELWASSGGVPLTNGRKVAWVVAEGRPWQPLMRYDIRSQKRVVVTTRADTFEMAGPTMSSRALAWQTYAQLRTHGSYRIVARDLRTGKNYGLASGTEGLWPRSASTVVMGAGQGWGKRVIWEQSMFDRSGHGRGYLAIADLP